MQKIWSNCPIQRVPALRVFWDLEKTVLHEPRVSGTVLWSPTNAYSPTYTYISQKRVSGNRVSDFRVSGGPPVHSSVLITLSAFLVLLYAVIRSYDCEYILCVAFINGIITSMTLLLEHSEAQHIFLTFSPSF